MRSVIAVFASQRDYNEMNFSPKEKFVRVTKSDHTRGVDIVGVIECRGWYNDLDEQAIDVRRDIRLKTGL